MASEAGFMKKPILIDHHQEQPQKYLKQQTLKCPRCDSSNTKFCYYNNYSLSQPRHFCKACKRYWTRGGTLRNVPVGGGCRKNKRSVKLPQTTTTNTNLVASSSQSFDHNSNNPNANNVDQFSLFYGLVPQNPNHQRLNSTTVSVSGYDFSLPQMSNLGLGFSSLEPGDGVIMANSSSFLSRSCPSSSIFVGSTSLLASGFQQQKQRVMDWSSQVHGQDEAMPLSDIPTTNSLLWNMTNGNGECWFDPTSNIDSSVPSLI